MDWTKSQQSTAADTDNDIFAVLHMVIHHPNEPSSNNTENTRQKNMTLVKNPTTMSRGYIEDLLNCVRTCNSNHPSHVHHFPKSQIGRKSFRPFQAEQLNYLSEMLSTAYLKSPIPKGVQFS